MSMLTYDRSVLCVLCTMINNVYIHGLVLAKHSFKSIEAFNAVLAWLLC